MALIQRLITDLPKTELHVHIEGTLEPQMMFELGARNGFDLPFEDLDGVADAYDFTNLQSFLDIYYQGASVLQTPEDFYDLMKAYLHRAASDGVRHAEIFFDPQTHTDRGVGFGVFMEGFRAAIADTSELSVSLILCFLRHLSGDDALTTLAAAEDHLEGVVAVGLDSSEVGNPPELFSGAYDLAREFGLRAVAHAGEEGPPEYIVNALDVLGAERIDHGVRSLESPLLVERLSRHRVPLTVCPLSNVALKVVKKLEDHPLPSMIDAGLMVSIHSDDPAYFGGYVGDNYLGVHESLGFDAQQLAGLARNSINAAFIGETEKGILLGEVDEVLAREQG